jgi:tetratricopeptide (TPR) repeat protein
MAEKKVEPKVTKIGGSWMEGISIWYKKNSKVVLTILSVLLVAAAVIFFLNLNAANRNKNALEQLSKARASLMSRPHLVAAAVVDDPKYPVLPGTSPEAPAAYILTLLQQQKLEIQAIAPSQVKDAQTKLGITDEQLSEPMKAAELGKELGADFVLVTKNAPGKPSSLKNPLAVIGDNHWQALLVGVKTGTAIGQGAIWLEGTPDNPNPNSDFFLLERPYKVHTPDPVQCSIAAKDLTDITEHFSDTKAAKLAYLYLGDAYYQAGSFDDALTAYTNGATKVDNADLKFQCLLGAADSQLALGKNDEALNAFQNLLNDSSSTGKALAPEVLLRMAECYLVRNDIEGEKKVLAQLMKDYPDSPWLEVAQERYKNLFY